MLGVGGTGPLRGQPRDWGALCSLGVSPGGFWPLVRSQSPEPPPVAAALAPCKRWLQGFEESLEVSAVVLP